ncbi:MAG: Ig-like domain-containing protein [Gemmatimonas sp.]|uniref:Ig-like domain-containing protein n=1 Tax=Gemmatimonas sp. TaxID=1962908 RepID=UPI00391A0D55
MSALFRVIRRAPVPPRAMRPPAGGRAWSSILLAAVAATITACGGDPAEPDVPAVVTVTATGSTSVTSGATVQLTAAYRDSKGRPVTNPSITWGSADATVATVSATGLVTGARAGTATITATVAGTTGSLPITVTAGAAAKLTVVRQPAGAAQRTPLLTQPVVEVRDAADNLVTSSTIAVSVTTSIGGVSGTTTVPAQQGVARFTDLALQGVAGSRTLLFTAGNLITAASEGIDLAPGPVSSIALVSSALRLRSGVPAGATGVVAQLRDQDGNAVALSGRRVVASVTGGIGNTTVSGTTTATDAQGRAVFSALTVTGTAGTRSLAVAADSITTAATATVTLSGGVPTRVVIDRDVPATIDAGIAMQPAPVVRLVDALNNFSEESGVTVRVTSDGATFVRETAITDAVGRATFTGLTFATGAGTRTLRFGAEGLTAATSRPIAVGAIDTTTQPIRIVTARSEADTSVRVIELDGATSSLTPFLLTRDLQGQPTSPASVRWVSRDPSVATVSADGRITGAGAGRTFIVAQASRTSSVADSLLVFVPKSGTGPILRATLPSYRIATDTFSITLEIVPRDGRPLTAADFEVAWPGNRAFLFSPFNVTGFTLLRPGMFTQQVDLAQSLRVTWASATPVTGPVQLIRLQARVNQRSQGNQLVITLNQLLRGDLTDVTAATSIFNPSVIIP